jgi:transposase
MFIDRVPNRGSPPAILLRETWREAGKIRKRTLANLSHWPEEKIEALRAVLRGSPTVARLEGAFEIQRSLPHGHVAAALGTLRLLGLDRLMASRPSRQKDLCMAMIVSRLLDPASKLSTARGLGEETSTLAQTLGIVSADEDELYEAMDWLLARQGKIEEALARRHLAEGGLVLYDVTSTYFEGRSCALARLGHSRDGWRDRLQIVFGLLSDPEGRPVAVEVFEGNTADPKTFSSEVVKVKERFGLSRVVFVGDRGMITEARIREDLVPAGLEWITSLRAPSIRKLLEQGVLQLSLFDQKDLAEIVSPDYPGERLIVCKNPLLAAERARKREDLLRATEKDLEKIAAATQRSKRPLRGEKQIALRLGKVLGRFKMGKHFKIEIQQNLFQYQRDLSSIAQEACLDGLYVIRTNLPQEKFSAQEAVSAYKSLSAVEHAFRSLKSVDLKVRPIYHHLADRVRAHVFLCMLAYYVEWHMRQRLSPLLFDEENPAGARAARSSPVAPARHSPKTEKKRRTQKTEEGLPLLSFQDLLKLLATLCKNRVQPRLSDAASFYQYTLPTPSQLKAFQLLGVSPNL